MAMRKANFKLTLLLFALCYGAILYADSMLKTTVTPLGIVSYEFIGTVENSNAALELWSEQGRVAAAFSLGIDYLFLVLYSIIACYLLSGIAAKIAKYNSRWAAVTKKLIPLFIFAAVCDLVENFCLLQLLLGSQNELYPQLAYYFAAIKFSIIGFCLLAYLRGLVYLKKCQGRVSNL